MRIKTLTSGGYPTGQFNSPGGTLTGPLFLSRNPVEDLEISTKLYVDQVLSVFDGSDFKSGTIQIGRLPSFTGDLSSSPGSNVLLLQSNTIGSGVYTKVTVNSKGLVINGFGLLDSDIPNFSWDKITTGKPTTLAGYGITDALSKAGGTLTGNLILNADPVDELQLATKQYTDETISNKINLSTGDIIIKTTLETPIGFLRCNGLEISKSTYSNLYGIIGDNFSTGTTPPDSFKLPDLTSTDLPGTFSYIKT